MTSIGRISPIPLVWCIAVTLILGSAFREVSWSFVDTAVNFAAAADSRSWREFLSDSLTKSVEYRPMLDLGTRLAYKSIGLSLRTYQALVELQFVLLLAALVLIFRPVGWRQGVAASLALSIAVGLHTSRILFLFVPLNAYTASMLLVLAVVLFALMPGFRSYEWTLLPLTLVAMLWLELGVLIVPLVCAAWWVKAPGTTWRGVAATLAGFAIYLAMRLGPGPGVGAADPPDTGFGFSNISAAERVALFAETPWLLWLYNVGSSLLTVLASEPRAGRFQFIALVRGVGQVPLWMWLHVVSSVITTSIVFWYLAGVRGRPHRDRVIAALGGVLLIGGSLLGFLYTRDRIGLPAGIGYAMLAYLAVRALLERERHGWHSLVVVPVIVILGFIWTIRTAEMFVALRETAWDFHQEWDRPEAVAAAEQNPQVAQMRLTVLKYRPADPHRDPLWTYHLFERRFEPEKETP